MIAVHIFDVGILMNEMLKGSMFDRFLLQEAVITREVSYTIDGTLNTDCMDEESSLQNNLTDCIYAPFSMVKPLCLEMLKGKRKPAAFKFVFLLSPENQKNTVDHSGTKFRSEDIRGMYINLIYRGDILTCTTGISYQTFTMDKTLEKEWDRLTLLFLKQHNITSEAL